MMNLCFLFVLLINSYSIRRSRLIDGTAVLYEVPTSSNASGNVNASNSSALGSSPRGSSSVLSSGSGGNPSLNTTSSSSSSSDEQQPRSGPELPQPGHIDVIADMLVCRTAKQTFVASSSRDGVIKLWK